jgi:hypothetical protein
LITLVCGVVSLLFHWVMIIPPFLQIFVKWWRGMNTPAAPQRDLKTFLVVKSLVILSYVWLHILWKLSWLPT